MIMVAVLRSNLFLTCSIAFKLITETLNLCKDTLSSTSLMGGRWTRRQSTNTALIG